MGFDTQTSSFLADITVESQGDVCAAELFRHLYVI